MPIGISDFIELPTELKYFLMFGVLLIGGATAGIFLNPVLEVAGGAFGITGLTMQTFAAIVGLMAVILVGIKLSQ